MSEDTQNKDKQNEQDANGNQTTTDANSGGQQENNNDPLVSMPQSQMNAAMAERARRAKASATSEIAEMLGVDDIEQVKQILEAHKKAQEAEMSESEKLQARNNTLQQSLDAKTASYNHVLFQNAVILESAKEEYALPSDRTKSLLQLMNLDNLKVDNGEVSGVAEEIKRTLEQHPFLTFANPESDKDKLGDKGTQTKRDKRLKDVLDRVNENDKKVRTRKNQFRM
jgi:hypothetical protein